MTKKDIFTEEEFAFLLRFATEHKFEDTENLTDRMQFRVMWTAYCLHQDMEPGTPKYRKDIEQLWNALTTPTTEVVGF